MCGISGFFCFKKPSLAVDKKLFNFAEQAAYVGSMRGRDGTGIFQIDREYPDRTYVYKRAVDGAVFSDTMNFQGAIYSLEDNLATVIHNRKGTVGGNTDDMCHPHRIGDITLVHNGTLHGHRGLGGGNNYTSDSAAIAHALDVENVDAKNVLEDLDGAFTLIWHDASLKTINIARNSQRPLSVGFMKDSDVMLFASERGMLDWLAVRCDIQIEEYNTPAVGTHYYWNLEGDDVSVRKYGESSFTPRSDWDDYYGYGTNRNRTWNTKEGRWNETTPARGSVPAGNQSTTTAGSVASSAEKTARQIREDSIQSLGLKTGHRVKFVVYDAGLPSNVSGMRKIRGVDPGSQFECQAYIQWNRENQVKFANLQGALVEGSIHTVVNTKTYDSWPIIDCGNLVKISENFWEEGYDYKRENGELIVATGNTPQLPPPWERPSEFCDCDEDDKDRCTHKCIECAKAEMACITVDPDEEPVREESVQYQIGQNMYGSQKDWEDLVKYGCSECCCDLSDPDEVYFTFNDEPLCSDCVENWYDATRTASGKVH